MSFRIHIFMQFEEGAVIRKSWITASDSKAYNTQDRLFESDFDRALGVTKQLRHDGEDA